MSGLICALNEMIERLDAVIQSAPAEVERDPLVNEAIDAVVTARDTLLIAITARPSCDEEDIRIKILQLGKIHRQEGDDLCNCEIGNWVLESLVDDAERGQPQCQSPVNIGITV